MQSNRSGESGNRAKLSTSLRCKKNTYQARATVEGYRLRSAPPRRTMESLPVPGAETGGIEPGARGSIHLVWCCLGHLRWRGNSVAPHTSPQVLHRTPSHAALHRTPIGHCRRTITIFAVTRAPLLAQSRAA
ncbi:hypothetical protein DM860_010066 [Cuscuta australis]|uniref:Uncharacterized protein n=1 Tax=Cuscuta australis TaxID=267555 RepID=A0A328D5X5_9ASTE|nr:hypothetical protein DM860_010066 [Cuscuta australis]